MRKTRKLWIAVFLIVTAIFGLLGFVGCKDNKPSKRLEYELSLDKSHYHVIGIGHCTDTDIVIPREYNNLPVTEISYYAFEDCSHLTSITIPDSVTEIWHDAFRNCTSLSSITIPDSVTSIGSEAFAGCTNLKNVTIGKSVTSLDGFSLSNYKQLTNIQVNERNPKYKSIDGNLYNKDGTTLIQYALGKPYNSFAIPDGVTSIERDAFRNCTNLSSITIPDSVTSIERDAFRNCTNLTNITIPDSVTSIGSEAFASCTNLTNITIPDSVTSIGREAFAGCDNLLYEIKDGVKYLGNDENRYFYLVGTTSKTLRTLNVDVNCKLIGDSVFANYALTTVTIPDGVTSIGNYAFSGCRSLTSIVIPDSIRFVGEEAFENCSKLKHVTLPARLIDVIPTLHLQTVVITSGDSIKPSAFQDCTQLVSVTLPESITSIGRNAFCNCYRLVEIYNQSPLNIKVGSDHYGGIGYYAKAIYTEPYTSKVSLDENGYLLYTDGDMISLIDGGVKKLNLLLPNGITEINYGAFRSWDILKSVIIPDSVTSIGNYAFYDCTNLESLTISENLISIGDHAFSCCKITNINIPDSVTSIGNYAFFGCKNLTSVSLSDSLTAIGDHAFSDCDSLTSITIPDSVTSIGDGAFSCCDSLTNITIPNGVISIDRAFTHCCNLETITIPSSVKSLISTFFACYKLTEITFEGTRAQWRAIAKDENWNHGVPASQVICSDGVVKLENSFSD